jgi:hypothetical protein
LLVVVALKRRYLIDELKALWAVQAHKVNENYLAVLVIWEKLYCSK